MNCFLFTIAACLLLQSVLAQNVTPTTCEDVLPADVCTKLRSIAAKFHEQAGTVNAAVIEAFNHHKTKAAEMLSYVKEYLVQKANNVKCEELLKAETCEKLKKYAIAAHVKVSEVSVAVMEAIVQGTVNANEMYTQAVEYISQEITCERFLGEDKCFELRQAAAILGEKASTVNEAVREAFRRHISNIKDMTSYVRDILVETATNFKCENVLAADLCASLVTIGGRLKLTHAQVTTALEEAIAKGVFKAKSMYQVALGFLMNDVSNLACEDLASPKVCQDMLKFAKKMHLTAKDTARAIKEAIIEGASTAAELHEKAREYLKAQFSCDRAFSKETCEKIQSVADKFSVSLTQVNDFLREAVANGASNAADLYKQAVVFITQKWTEHFGDEEMVKRSIGSDSKARVAEAVEMLLEALE